MDNKQQQTRTIKQTLIHTIILTSTHPGDTSQKLVAASLVKDKILEWYNTNKDQPILHFYNKPEDVNKFTETNTGLSEQWINDDELDKTENNYFIYV